MKLFAVLLITAGCSSAPADPAYTMKRAQWVEEYKACRQFFRDQRTRGVTDPGVDEFATCTQHADKRVP